MKGMTVTSAYPVTWMRREWSPQEERSAKDVDGMNISVQHCRSVTSYFISDVNDAKVCSFLLRPFGLRL
jgi:hypothetical protein